MKNQLFGIALILLGIIVALPVVAGGYGIYFWIAGLVVGIIGFFVVLENSVDNEKEKPKENETDKNDKEL